METKRFKDYEAFDKREDRSVNGVSPDFEGISYDSNTGCWNCSGCKDCTDCFECTDCHRCKTCASCQACVESNDCWDCFGCYRCEGCNDCKHCTDIKDGINKNTLRSPFEYVLTFSPVLLIIAAAWSLI